MKTNLDCVYCIIKKADERCEKLQSDNNRKLGFMKNVFRLIGESKEDVTAPYLSKCVNDLLRNEFGFTENYSMLKTKYNKLMLELEEKIQSQIDDSNNPLLSALRYAMVGNFIDFAAMDTIDQEKLNELIQTAESQNLDERAYGSFCKELSSSKNLVYLLDNAGEIVFDKLFIRTIKTKYPNLHITAIVRGMPVFNDVTFSDAKEVGLAEIVPVLDNGTDIPGTQLDKISVDAKRAIDSADLIISKGQGNFETLYGCGKNIYYIFLCKCDLFVRRFAMPQFSGVFANEKLLEFED
jgi:damage-control phosphatase, subfamily I